MKQTCYTLFLSLWLSITLAKAQGVDWERNEPGKLFSIGHSCTLCPVQGSNQAYMNEPITPIVNRVAIFNQPKGFDLHEWKQSWSKLSIFKANFHFNFYQYYSYEGGKIQLSDGHPHNFSININDPSDLFNEKSVLDLKLPTEIKPSDPWANLPAMFTDTLELVYKPLNGYTVGEAYDSGWNYRVWVINPKRIKFFREVTQDEYVRRFLGKLQYDINELENGIAEMKKGPEPFPDVDLSSVPDSLRDKIRKTLAEARKGAEEVTKSVQPDMEKLLKQNQKYLAFLRTKQSYFQRMLKTMTAEQRQAPAHLVYYENAAVVVDKDGTTVKKIEGHLQNEPYEGVDAAAEIPILPVYTFAKEPFSKTVPKTAFQLITVHNPYDDDAERDQLKAFIKNDGILKINFKALGDLMFK